MNEGKGHGILCTSETIMKGALSTCFATPSCSRSIRLQCNQNQHQSFRYVLLWFVGFKKSKSKKFWSFLDQRIE